MVAQAPRTGFQLKPHNVAYTDFKRLQGILLYISLSGGGESNARKPSAWQADVHLQLHHHRIIYIILSKIRFSLDPKT